MAGWAKEGTRLGTQLLIAGWLTEAQLASFLSEQLGLPSMHRLDEVDPQAVALLPPNVAVQHRMLPIRLSDGVLEIALADPSDIAALDAAHRATERPIRAVIAPELVVSYGLRRFYRPDPVHEPAPHRAQPQFARATVGLDALGS